MAREAREGRGHFKPKSISVQDTCFLFATKKAEVFLRTPPVWTNQCCHHPTQNLLERMWITLENRDIELKAEKMIRSQIPAAFS